MVRKALLQGVFAMGVAGAVLLSGACGMATKQYADDAKIDQPIRSVLVAGDSGSVKIRTGNDTNVHRDVHHISDRPGPTHRIDGDVLILESCPVRDCWVDYDVVVPADVTITGKLDSGDVSIDGAKSINLTAHSGDVTVRKVSGSVNLDVDSGTVDVADIGDNVSIEASSGDVKANQVAGSVDVGSSSGDIEVSLSEVGSVKTRSSSGDVRITVPQGKYRVTADVDSGSLDNGVGDDQSATDKVDVSANSGDVSIKFA
jgi:hypothetical protein